MCWCKPTQQCQPAPALALPCTIIVPKHPQCGYHLSARPCQLWHTGFCLLGHLKMCPSPSTLFSIPPFKPPSISSSILSSILPFIPSTFRPSLPSVVNTGYPWLCPAPEPEPGHLPREMECPEVSSIGISTLAAWAIKEFASEVFIFPSGAEMPKVVLGGEAWTRHYGGDQSRSFHCSLIRGRFSQLGHPAC